MSFEEYHPLEDIDDFQYETGMKRARDLASEGKPYQAAFTLGHLSGLLQSTQNRRGDGFPPEDPEGKRQIDEYLWWYEKIASDVDDLPRFEAIAYAGMTAALASYRLPTPAAMNVGRWAEQERDDLVAGDAEALRRARERYADAVDYVPPGFGRPGERTSMVESAEHKAVMNGWGDKVRGGWIPPY